MVNEIVKNEVNTALKNSMFLTIRTIWNLTWNISTCFKQLKINNLVALAG